jgi:fructose-bisphosphate aldolase class II
MIVTTADLYQIAYGKYAIGAYNVSNVEQILGMLRGGIDSQAPFDRSRSYYPARR